MIVVGIFLIYGISIFWIGYHNIDLGYNARYVELKYNAELIDIDVYNDKVIGTPSYIYSMGLSQILKGGVISLCSACYLGLLIGALLSSGDKSE